MKDACGGVCCVRDAWWHIVSGGDDAWGAPGLKNASMGAWWGCLFGGHHSMAGVLVAV